MKWLKKIERQLYDEGESPAVLYGMLIIMFAVIIMCGTMQIHLWMM